MVWAIAWENPDMRRLWMRLSLAFTAVVFASFFLITATTFLISSGNYFQSIITRRFAEPGNLVEKLRQYYAENRSWEGLQDEMFNDFPTVIPLANNTLLALAVTNESGEIIYSADPDSIGNIVPITRIPDAVPIDVDGRIRGYVLLLPTMSPMMTNVPMTWQPFLIENLTRAIVLVTVIVSVVGVIAGGLMSWSLTSPLGQLAETTRAFGKDRSVRAHLRGTEEIIDVAQAFNEMADALQNAEQLRRNLVADVAHEFRTPLTVLQANLQAILDDVYPLNKEEMQHLMEQTDLLRRLVNDLHDLAQADAGKLVLNLRPLELNAFVTNTVEPFRILASQQTISLSPELANTPIMIDGDPMRLAQVLNNLLSNAVLHTPSGRTVGVKTSVENDHAILVVYDQGTGIHADSLPHIFERFYRADTSRSRATGGVGLGLAIVKAIITMHHGDVSVSSDGIDGNGTAFTIRLPLATAHTRV
jgi:signal transduction histidine kinase